MNLVDFQVRGEPARRRNHTADEPMHPLQIKGYRAMTPAEKLDRLAQMWDCRRALMAAGIRSRRPEMSEEEVAGEVRERILYGAT